MRTIRRVPVPVRIALLITAATLVVFFVFSNANNRREHALLQNEALQAANIEQATLSNVLSVLHVLATTTTTSGGSTQAFQTEAQSLVHSPVSVALAKAYLSEYVVFAGVGDAFKVGQPLNQGVFSTFHPTGISVSTGPVVSAGDQSTATFAVGPPLVPSSNAIFLQFSVNPYAPSILPIGPTLSGLQVALYGSPNPARANLIIATSTNALPWPGPVVSVPFAVGNTTWTLEATAENSLIGTFATVAPLVILILGLLLALSMGFTVEALMRRRRSALVEPEAQARIAAELHEEAPMPEAPVPQEGAKSIDQETLAESSRASAASSGEEDTNPVTEPPLSADWRPDPFGRSELRRFFLGSPTSLVRDGTTERYDPVPQPLEQAEVASTGQPPVRSGGKNLALPDDDDLVPSDEVDDSESAAFASAGNEPLPTADEQAIETMAAHIAGTIAEEIDGLLGVASVHDRHAPASTAPPAASTAPPAASTAPPAASTVTPPPPKPPVVPPATSPVAPTVASAPPPPPKPPMVPPPTSPVAPTVTSPPPPPPKPPVASSPASPTVASAPPPPPKPPMVPPPTSPVAPTVTSPPPPPPKPPVASSPASPTVASPPPPPPKPPMVPPPTSPVAPTVTSPPPPPPKPPVVPPPTSPVRADRHVTAATSAQASRGAAPHIPRRADRHVTAATCAQASRGFVPRVADRRFRAATSAEASDGAAPHIPRRADRHVTAATSAQASRGFVPRVDRHVTAATSAQASDGAAPHIPRRADRRFRAATSAQASRGFVPRVDRHVTAAASVQASRGFVPRVADRRFRAATSAQASDGAARRDHRRVGRHVTAASVQASRGFVPRRAHRHVTAAVAQGSCGPAPRIPRRADRHDTATSAQASDGAAPHTPRHVTDATSVHGSDGITGPANYTTCDYQRLWIEGSGQEGG